MPRSERTDGTVECKGCGDEVSGATRYRDDDGQVIATLCVGCQDLMGLRGDAPADIDQGQYAGGDE
jgi:hypothetical protein